MPKSGCSNNKVDIKIIDAIDQIQPGKFVFSTHKDKSHALKTTNKGFANSLGWKLKFPM